MAIALWKFLSMLAFLSSGGLMTGLELALDAARPASATVLKGGGMGSDFGEDPFREPLPIEG